MLGSERVAYDPLLAANPEGGSMADWDAAIAAGGIGGLGLRFGGGGRRWGYGSGGAVVGVVTTPRVAH